MKYVLICKDSGKLRFRQTGTLQTHHTIGLKVANRGVSDFDFLVKGSKIVGFSFMLAPNDEIWQSAFVLDSANAYRNDLELILLINKTYADYIVFDSQVVGTIAFYDQANDLAALALPIPEQFSGASLDLIEEVD